MVTFRHFTIRSYKKNNYQLTRASKDRKTMEEEFVKIFCSLKKTILPVIY